MQCRTYLTYFKANNISVTLSNILQPREEKLHTFVYQRTKLDQSLAFLAKVLYSPVSTSVFPGNKYIYEKQCTDKSA